MGLNSLVLLENSPARLLLGVIAEVEGYSQDDGACHVYRNRLPQIEMLFDEPGLFYVVVTNAFSTK